ncbi:tyrosine-protein phosphatase [Arthrobacter celericrescens]|uniref:tyrosine-protein phosphatase n=1 Tax=Arthrobacter celericrescens TaxID=2320851 RepID=UPI000EA2EB1A|nr:tyrosine-protein phosphatase [Arthrobacter celericrescens]
MDGRAAASLRGGVPWDGAVNAWHIAGDVYRMGRREWLTPGGWQQMYDDGVRTVIDLRSPRERQPRDTDPDVPAELLQRFEVVQCPTEDPDAEEFGELFGPYLKDPAHYGHYLRLFSGRLAAVFKAIAAARGKVVVHCSAGRDRSGIVAVMLQLLAGAGEEEVVRGYRQGMRGINERHRTHGVPHVHERYLDDASFEALLETREASLLEFVRSLDVPGFLLANGLTAAEVEAVRAKLGPGPRLKPAAKESPPTH